MLSPEIIKKQSSNENIEENKEKNEKLPPKKLNESKIFQPMNLNNSSNTEKISTTTSIIQNKISEDNNNITFPIIVPSFRFNNDRSNFKNLNFPFFSKSRSGNLIQPKNLYNETFDINNIEKDENNNNHIFNKYESFDEHNFIYREKTCCTCTKTQCIKKYCECFANGKFCFGCHCINCLNKSFFQKNDNNNNIKNIINNNEENFNNNINLNSISCTCSKSGCNKKYCECFKAGKNCNEKCRCLNCLNRNKNEENENLNSIYLNERKNSLNDNFNNHEDFTIQTTSVFISKNQTFINVEKIGKEKMKLLSLKRNREKNNKLLE